MKSLRLDSCSCAGGARNCTLIDPSYSRTSHHPKSHVTSVTNMATNKRVNGLLILERARTRNAIEKTEAVEKKFQTEFEAYKSATGETIKSLEASLDDVQTQLQTAQRQLRDMFALKEENQRRKEECARMKQSLKRVCL